jgi:hypothetical protein
MSRSDLFATLLILFVCAQPIFWLVALRRYKRYVNLRLRRIEQKLSLVCDCLRIEDDDPNSMELVRELVRADLKSEAIEMFCEQTGAGLADAQRVIQAMEKGRL